MTKNRYFSIDYYENIPMGKVKTNNLFFQLFYCQRGRLTHETQISSALLIHGDACIVPPNSTHTMVVNTPFTAFFVVTFSTDFLNDTNLFLTTLKSEREVVSKISLIPDEIVFFEGTIYKILNEYNERKENYEDIIINCLKSLLGILHRTTNSLLLSSAMQNQPNFYSKEKMIKYCVSYVDAHCCENISLTDITRLSAMSRSLFCNLFKKETGLSFNDYLNRKRIQKALVLVKRNEKITEISHLCGYAEFSTFYRNFHKFTGYTPLQYKKIYENPSTLLNLFAEY